MSESLRPIKHYLPENEKWAVILNHSKFDTEPSRPGTEKDVDRLREVLNKVKCNYVLFDNLSSGDILVTVPKFVQSNLERVNEMDGLLFFILTHGANGNALLAKNEGYNLYDFINKFDEINFPMMANKPKLFFISACRGNEFQTTRSVNLATIAGIQTDAKQIIGPIRHRQMYTNLLISFGTFVNCFSIRYANTGTIFIQELCQAFDSFIREANATETDILSILLEANRRIIEDKEGLVVEADLVRANKQLAQVYSSLTAPCIFRKNNKVPIQLN